MTAQTNSFSVSGSPRVKTRLTRLVIAAILLQLAAPQNLPAAPVSFATEPMSNSTGTVHPNLLFMLDESASMAEDFLPEYVQQETIMQYSAVPVFNGQFATCFDPGDSNFGSGIQDNPRGCKIGDPPHMSSDFNRIYYDPSITYTPGIRPDGVTPFTSQTNPAAVQTDPYGVQQKDQLGNSVSSINIVTGYPDRVWCTANGDAANGPNCLKNNLYKDGTRTDYTYPDAVYTYGLDAASINTKYVFGNPYYYKIIPTQYCSDTKLTNCIATAPGVVPTGANAAYSIPAPVRWCKYKGTTDTIVDYNNLDFTENDPLNPPALNNCQAKQTAVYQYPRFLGKVNPATAGHAAYAVITVPSNPASYQDITSITLGPLPITASNPNIINGTLSGYTSASAAATAIAASINSQTTAYPIIGTLGTPYEFIACAGSGTSGTGCNQPPFSTQVPAPASVPANTAYVIPAKPGGAWPGSPTPYLQGSGVYPTFPDLLLTGSAPSPGSVTIPAIGIYPVTVSAITVNGANVLTGGSLVLAAGTSASAAATAIAARIGNGFAASASGGVITATSTTNIAVLSLSISATSTNFSTIAAPSPTSGNTPLIVSAVVANGTNALTSTLNIAPGTSAITVASLIAANIGNGYTATNLNPQTSVAGGTDFITAGSNATISTLTTTAVNSYGSVVIPASGTTLPDYISAINVTAGATTNALTGGTLTLPAGNSASANALLISTRIGNGYTALPANVDPISGAAAPGTVFIISASNQKITAVASTATHTNYGSLTPPAVVAGNDITLTAITANGTNLLGSNLVMTAPKTAVQATSAIAAAITANSGVSGFSANIVGSAIWINSSTNAAIATLTTTSVNYGTIVVPAPNTGPLPNASTTPLIVSAITVNGSNRLGATVNFVPNNPAVNDATQIVAGIGGGFSASNVAATSATITIKSGTNLVIDNTLAATANDSYGTVTALATGSFPAFISVINVTAGATTNLLASTLTIPANQTAAQAATLIAGAINGNAGSGYTATANAPTSGTVYIIKTVIAPSTNAKITAVTVSSTATNYGTLTPPVVGIYPVTVTGLTVNGVNVWTGGNLVLPALQTAVNNAAAIAARITVAPYSATNVDPATALPSGTVFITSTTNVAIATLVPAVTFTSYGTLVAPAAGSGTTPLLVTAVTINGANHLTAPVYIAPGVSQTIIAQLVAANIGTGFTATNVTPPSGPAGGTDYIVSSPAGTAIAAALTTTAVNSFGTLTAVANPSATLPAYVSSISVNGSNVLASTITIAAGASAVTAANNIVTAINANSGVSGVSASNGGTATVTIIKCTIAGNLCTVNPSIIAMGAVSAPTYVGTLTVPATANYPATVTAVNITATGPGTRPALTGSVVIPANTSAAAAAALIQPAITANGYIATVSGATITIYSPTSANNFPITNVTPVVTFVNYATLTAPAGGSGTTPLIIKAVTVNGANVLTVASLNLAPGLTQAQVATAIAANIGLGFTATANVPTVGTVYIFSTAGPGTTVISTLTTNAYNNSGTITPPATTNLPGVVTAININGANVMTPATPLVIPANTSAAAAAALIQARIPLPWVKSLAGNVITVQGGAALYNEITALSVTTAPTNYATLTFPQPVDPNFPVTVLSVNVNGTNVLPVAQLLPVTTSGAAAASQVNGAINQGLGYTTSVAGNVITIFNTATPTAAIGSLTAPFTTTYYGTFVAPAANGTPLIVNAVTLNGTNKLTAAPKFFQPAATAVQVATALAASIPGATNVGGTSATVTVPNGNTPVVTLTVTANNTYGTVIGATPPNGLPGFVTSITVNGTNVLASTLTIAANATPSAAASTIAAAVGSGYSASTGGTSTVTIIKCTVAGINCTTDPTISTVAAVAAGTNYGTLTASATTLYPATVNNVMVNGVNALLPAGPVTIAAGQTAAQAATTIANAIVAGSSAFTASANSPTPGTVYVTSRPATTNAVINPLTASVTQTYYATLAAPAAGTTPLVITAVNVNGANVLSPTPLNIAPGQTAAQVASAIATRIVGGFSATANVPVSGTVYITSSSTPITTLTYAAVNSYGTLTAVAPPNGLPAYVTAVTVNGTNALIPASLQIPAGNTAAQAATLIAANIGSGYTASASGATVTITSNANAAIGTVTSTSNPTLYGSLTPPAVGGANVTLTAIAANGTALLSGNLVLTAGTSAATAASNISAAINANTGVSGFTSSVVGSSVYIYNPTTNIAVSTLTSTATNYGTLVAPAANGTVPLLVTQVLVNGTNVLATSGLSFPPSASATTVATTIAANINTGLGYTTTRIGSTLTFTSFPVVTNAVISSLSVTANNAAGTLAAAANPLLPAYVNSVTVNGGANILSGPLPLTLLADNTASQNATAIAIKINANSGTSGYSASASGATVTIISTTGTTNTNVALISSVASVVTPTYFGTLTPPLVGSSAVQITAVTVNGTNRLTGGTLTLIAGTTPASAATAIAARIGSGGYSATANVPTSGTVYIFASPNAPIATLTTTANSVSNGTITAPAAGTTPLVISAVTVNGSNILLGTLNIAPGTSATTVASLINAAIDTTNYTPSFSGSTVTLVRNDSAAITSVAVTAISSSGTLTAVAPGAVPMYISQVQINGSGNALTTPLAFSPGTTASAVASAIASNIGSGYSATSSGSLVTIISTTNAQITSVTTNATNAYSATLNVGNWTGAPSAGNGTISGITVGGIAVVGGPFNSTTPSALASAVAAGINAGGASFSPGGAPSATQYSAIASGNTVTVYSPLSGSAPAAISYGFSMPPNSPGPTTHASATLSIPPAEGALVPNATISSITIGGSASCPAYPSSASANLLSTNIGPDASGATLIADFVGKDKAGDNYTMAVNTVTRIVTFTENASGTAYTSLNGCLLNVAYGGAGTHTETPFALGNFANTSTNPSGGSFGGGGAVSLLPGPNNPTVPVTTATNAAAPYTMAPATGLGSYTLTGATNNTPANVAGTPNLGAYAMAPTPNLGGAYNLGPLPNNPAATLIATPNLGAYPVTTTPNLNGAFSLTPAANNPPVPVVTTPNLGGYTITPNFPVTFTYLVPTAINNVVANLSPLPNLGGFTTSTTNNSAVTFLPAPTFSNPLATFVGTGALGSYSIATATGLTGGPFSLSGAPFNPVVAMTATFGLGAYNAAPVTGLGGAYAPVSAANNPTVNLSPTAGLGTYTFPASISAAAGYIGTTSVPFTGSALSNLPNRSSVGVFQRVDIVPATPTYTVPATRTDCVGGTTCTYTEELTNFSNWYSFYRTRMQLMKTGAGLSFTGLGSGYRVGFITIHPATAPYVPIADFNSAQKSLWFTDFYSTDPNAPDPDHAGAPRQTPLRSAMSIAGRIFAGQKPAPATDDPMQYSCQQNFLLMTTDGYWLEDDETAVKELNGSRVNNQDSSAATPFKDGDAASGATSCPLGAGNVACLANTCQGNTNDQTSFSSCNTLADVAYYYYTTDLRDASLSTGSFDSCLGAPDSGGHTFDTCANNVPTSATDSNVKQHMTTFTLGLGIDGFLNFSQDYATNSSGDFAAIKAGNLAWPQVKFNDVTGVDDLWHAAVNGHGSYFSARDPKTLRIGISSALSSVSARIGAGAAAATSNLQPVAGDNYAFVGSYTTQLWTGNLEARAIDTQAGTVGDQALWCVNDTAAGSATTACSGGLKTQISGNSDSRNIFFFQSGGTNNLASFTWSNLPAAQQALFDPTQLNQYGALSAASKTQAGSSANATNLINWLRGQTDHEELASNTPVNQVFRARQGALGDVIGSQPVYVRGAHFQYGDPGYGAFLTAQSSRLATVYLGVNDGMLHAIDATTTGTGGKERWAYVPSQVMSNMTTLADDSYATLHKFFVDATPTIADICVSSCNAASAVWKTILIGGFNSGGRGYYALDITDPATPVGLWELTTSSVGLTPNQAVGYSFGNPIITKDNTGNWVVLLTSGYNNVSPGDGQGHLYVLNAYSGTVSKVIDLDASVGGPSGNVGSVANPSGFARVSGFNTDVVHNNQVTLLYGGDLLGNLWRIDFNAASTPAVKIAELTDASHVAQPITTKPELTLVGALRLVLLGTGKFLEQNDKTSAQTQTVYGIYDKYDALVAASDPAATLVDPHDTATSTMVAQILSCTLDATTSDGTSARNLSANPVASFSNRGWFVDLCGATTVFAGERVNVDPLLSQAVLKVASNIPQSGTCTTGGQSFINYFKFDTGGATALTGTNVGLGSISFGTKLVVGITENVLASGQHVILVTGSDTPTPKTLPSDLGQNGGAGVVQGRRSSWRELVQ